MPVHIVRHAHAGSRYDWHGDDDLSRPLTERGRARADTIAELLHSAPVTRIVSSPAVRCIETVAPLAGRLGIAVTIDERLVEGGPFRPVTEMVLDSLLGAGDVVLCSHGDVIPEVLDALARRGMQAIGDVGVRKGSIWTIDRQADGELAGRCRAP